LHERAYEAAMPAAACASFSRPLSFSRHL
jgi:hypothetical protein